MKKIMFAAFVALTAASAFAMPREPGYFSAELKAIEAETGATSLGNLKVSEVIPLAGRLDVARQKDRFVLLSMGLSAAWPGAGQFVSGEWGTGTLHTALHLGITAGSLVWANSLLPADLRWGTLNYFGDSRQTVKNAWDSHSFNEFLPAIGALSAGAAVDLALRFWSATDARTVSKAAIDAGKVTFEPRFDGAHWGFGARF